MAINKRRFQRIPFDAQIRLKLTNGSEESIITGILNDISLKGALIAVSPSTPAFKVGQIGELTIIPDQGEIQMTFTVEVAYQLTGNHLFGLNLLSFDVESASHLRRLVEVNLGDESSLKRELGNLVEAMEQEHRSL